ncbi:MAG: virulence protein RhuM/Fic/DOC family protein [Candidatus Komeilibacteria bacterium]|nr:virulence protein RhuM/Fic/DOC family protein [Candidatus Komeilibacteria bacterium]
MKKQENQAVVIYQAKSGALEFRGDFKRDTIWASQAQIAKVFGIERSVVTKHINNVLKDKEIDKKSNVQKLHIATSDKPISFYSLDVILSVGYRINSAKAIEFRIWATKILKKHLLDGYTINEKRLKENRNFKLKEMEKAVGLLQRVMSVKQLNTIESQGLLKVITDYTQTWVLLQQYDEGKLCLPKATNKVLSALDYEESKKSFQQLKFELRSKKEASDLFGQERGQAFQGIIGNLYQTFGGKDVYPSLEEKAAHLLYFVIKDHPFVDGNKRIGSFLFILFLVKNNYLLNKKGERKINNNALVALALLIAESDPKEKEVIITVVTNLLVN